MRKTMLIAFVLIFAVISLGITGTSSGQKKMGDEGAMGPQAQESYEPDKGERVNAFMVEKIVGSKVRNMKGEDLGTIQDIVVDIDSGRILYAVMDVGGFLGIGGKLFPVPWHSLAPLPSEGIFFLDISKARLKDSPSYDKDNLPDMGDMHWGTRIADFYEASREERSYDYGYGYGNRIGFYPPLSQSDPFEKIFSAESVRKISGEVIKVDFVIPAKGIISQMQEKLIVLVNGKEAVPVYLGPEWFVVGPNRRNPFKSGDKITATGSWITSQTEPFLIATRVTKGSMTFRLREKDGSPIWRSWKMEK